MGRSPSLSWSASGSESINARNSPSSSRSEGSGCDARRQEMIPPKTSATPYNQRNTQSDIVVRLRQFGGCSSPFNQPLVLSVFMGSGPSQLRHWNIRLPLPPVGHRGSCGLDELIRYSPHLLECPIDDPAAQVGSHEEHSIFDGLEYPLKCDSRPPSPLWCVSGTSRDELDALGGSFSAATAHLHPSSK